VGKASRQQQGRKRAAARRPPRLVRALKWLAAAAVLGLIGYAMTQMSGVPYAEDDIAVVDFSDLSSSARRSALQEVNRARCSCGCGMTLAQCVATDSTCPIRERNIERIRTVVGNHRQS